jgi:hypothetical protein
MLKRGVRVQMGTSNSVSSRVSRCRRESGSSDDEWNTLKVLECVDPIPFGDPIPSPPLCAF